uniref:NADH:ubiquinone reductase (H(+)-translocating) n=1 Tax=Eucallipterus tiliae TaxID=527681 RepID=A0A1L1YMP6_9HEMI|nr:NADH dehydrogenase subunit 5 [Eucallipterus tiliae]
MIFFIFGLFLVYFNKNYFIEYMYMYMNSCLIVYVILIDWMSMMFISFVFLISSMILLYSMEYMNLDFNSNRFLLLMVLFILFMLLLIISPNMISILLGWDGLGMVSFCLVVFYQNKKSYSSGFVTVVLNRMGDLFIIMSLIWMMNFGSWNFIYINYYLNFDYLFFIMLMIMIASLTKSAQIPFSSWLPLAMAAPTPVPSLVHFSTLVTAGIYLLIRISEIFLNFSFLNYLLIISCLTMFITGFNAIFEFDLKKAIAFPTLSQMSFMIMILCLGKVEMCFFYLLMHALFKSMMFLNTSILILNMINNQDICKLGVLINYLPFCSLIFLFSLMSLYDFPLFNNYYWEDWIFKYFLLMWLFCLFSFFMWISFFLIFFYWNCVICYLIIMIFSMYIFFWIIYIEIMIEIGWIGSISLTELCFSSFLIWIMSYLRHMIKMLMQFKLLKHLFWMIMPLNEIEIAYFMLKMKYEILSINIFFFGEMCQIFMISMNFFLNNFLYIGFYILNKFEICWVEYIFNTYLIFFFKKVIFINQKFFLNSSKIYILLHFLWFLIILFFNY